MNPEVSIIIATFNSEKTLRKSLQSVINQTFQDWECLIIDGESVDNTISIIIEYEKLDSRFQHISEKDTGIYDAMNKGWKLARGEWIYYLGSDDEIMPNGLKELLGDNRQSCNADIIYGNILYRYADGRTELRRGKDHRRLPWMMFGNHQCIITKKQIMEKLDGFDERLKIIADKDLFIRSYFLKDCRYLKRDVTVAIFTGGGTSSNYWKCFKEEFYIFNKLHLGIKNSILYILYILQRYPKMYIKRKLNN